MHTAFARVKRATGFISGVLIGLAIITPAFAAASTAAEEWGALLIIGATVLLAVGLMLRATLAAAEPVRIPADDSSAARQR